MPEVSEDDILLYIFNKKQVSAKDIENEFVETAQKRPERRIARGTLYNRLKTMCVSNLIIKNFDYTRKKGGAYSHYSISKEYYNEVEDIYLKNQLHKKIEAMSKEDKSKLIEHINNLESENRLLELSIEDDLPWDLFDKAEGYLNDNDRYEDDFIILKKIPIEGPTLIYESYKLIKTIRDEKGTVKFLIFAISKEKFKLLNDAEKRNLTE